MNLLEFQDNFQNQCCTQLKAVALPEDSEVTLDDLISKEDPTNVFMDLVKIGEGSVNNKFFFHYFLNFVKSIVLLGKYFLEQQKKVIKRLQLRKCN